MHKGATKGGVTCQKAWEGVYEVQTSRMCEGMALRRGLVCLGHNRVILLCCGGGPGGQAGAVSASTLRD